MGQYDGVGAETYLGVEAGLRKAPSLDTGPNHALVVSMGPLGYRGMFE